MHSKLKFRYYAIFLNLVYFRVRSKYFLNSFFSNTHSLWS